MDRSSNTAADPVSIIEIKARRWGGYCGPRHPTSRSWRNVTIATLDRTSDVIPRTLDSAYQLHTAERE